MMCSKKHWLAPFDAVECCWATRFWPGFWHPGFDPGCHWTLLGTAGHHWALLGTAGHICANFATCSWEPLTMLNPQFVAGEHGLFGGHKSEDIRTFFKGFCLRIFWNIVPMHINYRQFQFRFIEILVHKRMKKWTFVPKSGGLFKFCCTDGLIKSEGLYASIQYGKD